MSRTKDEWSCFEAGDRCSNLNDAVHRQLSEHKGLTVSERKKVLRAAQLLFDVYQSTMARCTNILDKKETK